MLQVRLSGVNLCNPLKHYCKHHLLLRLESLWFARMVQMYFVFKSYA